MTPTLVELLNVPDPAWPLVQKLARDCVHPVEILPVDAARGEQNILQMQITAHSFLGAVNLHTAGLIVDHGWLRILGAGGHPRLLRSLQSWNDDCLHAPAPMRLVADDILGGFFAMDGGALGPGKGDIYYLAPDRLEWEPLDVGYSGFFQWALTAELADFYAPVRWPGWQKEAEAVAGDAGLSVFPFLWSKEGEGIANTLRKSVPIRELFLLHVQTFPKLLGLPCIDVKLQA